MSAGLHSARYICPNFVAYFVIILIVMRTVVSLNDLDITGATENIPCFLNHTKQKDLIKTVAVPENAMKKRRGMEKCGIDYEHESTQPNIVVEKPRLWANKNFKVTLN